MFAAAGVHGGTTFAGKSQFPIAGLKCHSFRQVRVSPTWAPSTQVMNWSQVSVKEKYRVKKVDGIDNEMQYTWHSNILSHSSSAWCWTTAAATASRTSSICFGYTRSYENGRGEKRIQSEGFSLPSALSKRAPTPQVKISGCSTPS